MKLLANVKIRRKLIGAFAVMAVIVAATGTYGIVNLGMFGKRVVNLMETSAASEKVVLMMEQHQKACRVNLVEGAMVRNSLAEFEKYVETYRKKDALFRENAEILLKGNSKLHIPPAKPGSQLEKQVKAVLSSWEDFTATADELITHKSALLKNLHDGVIDQAALQALADNKLNTLATKTIKETSEAAKMEIDDLADYLESQMVKATKESVSLRKAAITTFLLVTLIAAVVAIMLGGVITRWLVASLRRMDDALNQGAAGNLAVKATVTSTDELGMLAANFNIMTEKLAAMISRVNGSSGELAVVAQDITEASRQVAESAHLQMGGINTTSSAITQINVSLKTVAEDVDSLSLNADESASSVTEMAASVDAVAQNTQKLSADAEEISTSLLEMVTSMQEVTRSVVSLLELARMTAEAVADMDGTIRNVQQNAIDMTDLAKDLQLDATSGNESVKASIDGIAEIRSASRITSEVISSLSEKAVSIGTILTVIDDVAGQTNLLALNAAIIAAQAGEHGKGFAVVADEIKALAMRTSNSTREIAAVVKAVQDETARAVEAIALAETRITDGEALSRNSGDALDKIVGSAEQATGRMEQIATAMSQQAAASRTIMGSMEQVATMVAVIDRATQEQSQGGQQIAAAAERMKAITSQVSASLQEQNKVANSIARSMESISDRIRQIRRSSSEQSKGSEQIVMAVTDIQDASSVNVQITDFLGVAARRLSSQVVVLQEELGRFTVHSAEQQTGQDGPDSTDVQAC